MHFKLKQMSLEDFYELLMDLSSEEKHQSHGIEIGQLTHGLGLKLLGKEENVTLYFYPGHPTSEISIMRNGMRYIFSKRCIRIKKHGIMDLINILRNDERLFSCAPMIQWHLNDIVRNEYYMTSKQLS